MIPTLNNSRGVSTDCVMQLLFIASTCAIKLLHRRVYARALCGLGLEFYQVGTGLVWYLNFRI